MSMSRLWKIWVEAAYESENISMDQGKNKVHKKTLRIFHGISKGSRRTLDLRTITRGMFWAYNPDIVKNVGFYFKI